MEKKTRFTTKIKTEIVLSLLRGESMEAASRKYGVTIADLSFWRDQFIEHGADGFKRKPDDSRLKEAERMIGKLQMELELTIKENELPDNRHQHVLKDEIIEFTGVQAKNKYPKRLRRVAIWDDENQQVIELITNQMSWTANTISELYRSRWQIEIFFREIKQLLHIKSFIGTSENAVMIQIWTALITILVLKYLKALARYGWRLSNLVAFIRLNMFVKIDLQKWLDKPFEEPPEPMQNYIQGVLF